MGNKVHPKSNVKMNFMVFRMTISLLIIPLFIIRTQAQEEWVDTNLNVTSNSKIVVEDFAYPINLLIGNNIQTLSSAI